MSEEKTIEELRSQMHFARAVSTCQYLDKEQLILVRDFVNDVMETLGFGQEVTSHYTNLGEQVGYLTNPYRGRKRKWTIFVSALAALFYNLEPYEQDMFREQFDRVMNSLKHPRNEHPLTDEELFSIL